MTFRQRLIIAFSMVIVLPMLLFMIAFFVIGNFMAHGEDKQEIAQYLDYKSLTEDYRQYSELLDSTYEQIQQDLEEDPAIVEDPGYLQSLSERVSVSNSYILVRKGEDLYYTGNEIAAAQDFPVLPGYSNAHQNEGTGIYIDSMSKMVKQLDFVFEDGSEGSIFIITKVVSLVSRQFLAVMFIAMVLVLLLTAFLLTRWLEGSFFNPINKLNVAMNNIRDGNLDYRLQTSEEGEIGNLYQNYEDMRLRLKESAEEKLERERQNSELITNISHDLKTPITSIKGYVEGLMDGVANTPEKQERYIKTIYSKANDMDNLINELTLYSRIDNDKIPYNFHRINVADYFGDCVEEIGMDMESRGITLNYSNMVAPDTRIVADPEQMKRVINNIVGNSVKYMDKPDGRIDIRIMDEEDSIRVEIEDNGKGIAAKDLPNIFDRFYRTDSSRNSAQGGSGIGLSIVRKVIEDHGGYVWATSRDGEGTCVHFVIRKYHETSEPEDYVEEEAAKAPSKGSKKRKK